MLDHPRPEEKELFVDKTRVKDTCPECGSDDVRYYDVVSEGGWWEVVKCQACLHSLDRNKASNQYGGLSLLTDLL